MKEHKVIDIRNLTDLSFVIRLERNRFSFQTGQFILLSAGKFNEQREYSIYSGENEKYLEVLIREVEGGKVSKQLKKLNPGDFVKVDGPFGFFKFHPDTFSVKKFLFVATGTGISPFHSFVKTFPTMDYNLIHGIRFAKEAYDHDDYDSEKVKICTSGDSEGDFNGRVTDYIVTQKIDPETNCFLCGNSEMIHEVFDILTAKGVPVSNIYSEVYF